MEQLILVLEKFGLWGLLLLVFAYIILRSEVTVKYSGWGKKEKPD